MRSKFCWMSWVVVCALCATGAKAQKKVAAPGMTGAVLSMTPVKPESVGFSSERLERLHALIQDEIDQKHLAGAVTILARHGKVVDYRTYGVRDLATGAPMTKDTIFRDYSMTQAGDRRGHDDPVRAGQMAAQRSDREIHTGVRAPEGV